MNAVAIPDALISVTVSPVEYIVVNSTIHERIDIHKSLNAIINVSTAIFDSLFRYDPYVNIMADTIDRLKNACHIALIQRSAVFKISNFGINNAVSASHRCGLSTNQLIASINSIITGSNTVYFTTLPTCFAQFLIHQYTNHRAIMKQRIISGVIFHHQSVNDVVNVAPIVFCQSVDAVSVVFAVVANLYDIKHIKIHHANTTT